MSEHGEYKVFEDGGQHCVVFQRAAHPDIWQVIARFVSADRAEDYAETENVLMDEFPEDPHRHDDAKTEPLMLPAPQSNLSKLQFPQGVAVKGEIAKRTENPIFSEPEKVPESTLASEPQEDVKAAPEPVNSRQKAAGAPRQNKVQRRFTEHFECDPENVTGLPENHPAVVEGRTLFPTTVVDATKSPGVLVSGKNHRKTGDRVVKGPWTGMPIYCLTLEERATCPDTCHMWRQCYGNGMPLARRHQANGDLRFALTNEILALNEKHPDGFVVRLHILGDFHSETYAAAWGDWLEMAPALHAFGYTAYSRDSAIGKIIKRLTDKHWDRFAIRFSDPDPKPQGATTIWREDRGKVAEGIVCPAQTGDTDCCGTCGLCWSDEMRGTPIAFMAHGRAFKQTESVEPSQKKQAEVLPPRKSTTRADQYYEWLLGLAERGEFLPWTKTSTAEMAGVPKGSMGYIFDTLKNKGFVLEEGETEDGGWYLTLKDGAQLRTKHSGDLSPSEPADQPAEDQAPQPRATEVRTSSHCATEDCRNTRQPGRDYCATCLTKRTRPNARGNMRVSGGSI